MYYITTVRRIRPTGASSEIVRGESILEPIDEAYMTKRFGMLGGDCPVRFWENNRNYAGHYSHPAMLVMFSFKLVETSEDWCAYFKALDAQFTTDTGSPLHHDWRCPIHGMPHHRRD